MKWKQWFNWKWIVGVLILGGLIALSLRPQPVPVEAVAIDEGPLEVSVAEDGRTRVKNRFAISAPISGKLLRVDLKPGDLVHAGETRLATIVPESPNLLDARGLAEARARVSAAQAELARAEAELPRIQSALQLARNQLDRQRRLMSGGHTTAELLETHENEVRLREAEARAQDKAVHVARYNVELAEAALIMGESEDASGVLDITAPVNGKVFRVFQESEGFVQAGTSLLELADPRDLEIVVDLLSKDAVKVSPGARVQLEHWGGERPLEGRVRLVEPSGFTKISALGVEEQRVNTVIDITTPPETWENLGDGFRVSVRIITWEAAELLLVPTGALFYKDDTWSVFKMVEGRAEMVPVKLGRRNGLHAELQEGLQRGDRVILYPSDEIQSGSLVEIL
ncbi:HlyD family efflux transporter periplasmic adaptor subunit [Sulfidibacter corallicola]|uniref:HlyD family efflux transporter periplasmic adaptor subunit n=1 Tax=Sulfidibacter corallicola TaxID=2818388 RepID=A0A8A4TSN2_SULCO|nr:HlyD family efflux transporter periplasmic adaptor subunit [Sulfidibacter corallicola]QTD52969.1 HlyD family efflux transporter periplasmic adaptor subunit [Sulfidibacter corallicola]